MSVRVAFCITQDPYSIATSLILASFMNPKSASPGRLTELARRERGADVLAADRKPPDWIKILGGK